MKLNLGCGPDKRPGYINADFLPDAPVWCDLTSFPWQWEDASVDEVLMMHVFEHLPDTYKTLAEIKRILKSGGVFRGQVPHAMSYAGMMHPQHYRHFTAQSFIHLSLDFGLQLVTARNVRLKAPSWKYKVRNALLPMWAAPLLEGCLFGVYDAVDFELRKP